MNNLLEIDIKDLIPQKEPFIMVGKLLHCDWERTKTSLSIQEDNIFVENGVFSQSGIIENVAQTCAARLGYLNRDNPVRIGMIGSIDDFEFPSVLPKVGQEIITEIIVEAAIGQVVLLNASVLCGEQKASGKMKVVLTDTAVEITGERAKITGEESFLTGEDAKITGEESFLTGEDAALTGEDAKITGEESFLTGEDATLTGEDATLTGEESALTGEESALTGDLKAEKEVEIRFSEVDSMGIVWHGSYALYFEDAREEFGKKFNLEYLYIFEQGFYAPLVELHFEYKFPLKYRDRAKVEITYRNTDAAKIVFDYKILSLSGDTLIATGHSVQVFLDKNFQLVWELPEFMKKWKAVNGIE